MTKESDGGGRGQTPEREGSEPAPERPAPTREPEAIALSLEEKGMVTMPAVPIPTNEVDIGNMPSANTGSPESKTGGGRGDSADSDGTSAE